MPKIKIKRTWEAAEKRYTIEVTHDHKARTGRASKEMANFQLGWGEPVTPH